MTNTKIAGRLSGFLLGTNVGVLLWGAITVLVAPGCQTPSILPPPSTEAGSSGGGITGTGGAGGKPTVMDGGALVAIDAMIVGPGKGCGNGKQDGAEQCDDGNTNSGDGCNGLCQVEANWVCREWGQPCEYIAKCGNGIVTIDEQCDDNNTEDGDGCSHDCQTIESGWQCRVPGKPCTPSCGDGVISGSETCDDGNTVAGDGCSTTCHLELGFKCEKPGTPCAPTTCGDGKPEGAESCDDGNTTPFDGCSEDCQIEPKCTAGGGCTSQCGDGIVLGEECDDGNLGEGDGCSKSCKTEPGWTCKQPDMGDTMLVPVVYRDFRFQKPADFQAGVSGSFDATSGMVKDSLSADNPGKPVLVSSPPTNAHVASADTFKQWYTDVAGVNHATAAKLTLWNDGKGNYVNRYGANGEQWNKTIPANYCGTSTDPMLDTEGNPIPCTFKYQYDADTNPTGGKTDCQKMEDQGYTQLPGSCHLDNGTYKALYIVEKVDGNPLFFPVDNDNFTPASEYTFAQIPPYYDEGKTWPHDVDADGKDIMHNFSFTSEVRYWFPYDKSKSYTLDFVGDDDVWVFINGKLAVDLGGVHTPIDGSIVIGSNGNGNTTVTSFDANAKPNPPTKSTASLGLQDGKVYEIAVFQAERQTSGSSYKLTLSGFNAAPSNCVPTCGDGVVVADEECDCGNDPDHVPARCSGPNADGVYGGCTTQCKWGSFCGDGIPDDPNEECDEGKNNGSSYGDSNGCSVNCTKSHFCGDGKPDPKEQCDLGPLNGVKLNENGEPAPDDPKAQVNCSTECVIVRISL